MDRLTSYIKNIVLGDKNLPAFSMEVKRHGKSLYSGCFGFFDYQKQIPLKDTHLFYMYSMTKPITVSAVLRLVEEGKLSLSDRLDKYIPEFSNAFLIKDGKKVKPKTPITIKHLFTMTAGYNYNLYSEDVVALKEKSFNKASTREVVAKMANMPLISEPGETFNYSVCHDILAAVAEVLTGEKFCDYVQRIIFDPLGMTNSYMRLTKDVKERIVAQYVCNGDGYDEYRHDSEFYITEDYDSGGAGLISTAKDYSIFADTLANGGTANNGYRLLKPETVKLLHTPVVGSMAYEGGFTFLDDDSYHYGLGVRTRVKAKGTVPVGEFGWDGAAGSYVCMDTITGLSVVFTMHARLWPYTLRSVHNDLRDLAYRIFVGE